MNTYEIIRHNQLWILTCKTTDGTISTVTMSGSKLLVHNMKVTLENQQCVTGNLS
jgi:hypothetical protein